MELEGTVQNGVIVPEGDYSLPEGTRVRILPNGESAKPNLSDSPAETPGQRLNRLSDRLMANVYDLPADYSVNFEHYLYGTPKRS